MFKSYGLDKEKIPFLYFLLISAWWSFYYQSNSFLNDFGDSNFEYLYLIDGLLVLPALCLWLIKDKKAAAFKAVALASLVIFIAGFIVPENEQVLLKYLQSLKYLAVSLIITLEVIAVLTVLLAIKSAILSSSDPDESICKPIKKIFGDGVTASAIIFETRVWTYVLFHRFIKKSNFLGQHHFDYHEKDGAQVDSLGFVFLILFELPLMHAVLHFIWSPSAATVVSILTVFGLLFLIAEYRAIGLRPVSIADDKLVIRYGVWNAYEIKISQIKSISFNQSAIRRSKTNKIYNYFGVPNVVIELTNSKYQNIYLGLDSPHEFIEKIDSRID